MREVKDMLEEIQQRNLASEEGLDIIKTYNNITQREFCEKILRQGWSVLNCISWYNSWSR